MDELTVIADGSCGQERAAESRDPRIHSPRALWQLTDETESTHRGSRLRSPSSLWALT